MSQIAVESILGRGIEIERSHDTATFIWQNSDCSSIKGEFANDLLKSKSQLDLK
ncbi:MAG: hypothetical protein AAFQ80_10295 [Cyanobacteria bacterium J06621_8]